MLRRESGSNVRLRSLNKSSVTGSTRSRNARFLERPMGLLVAYAAIVIVVNIATDLTYSVIDPRIGQA